MNADGWLPRVQLPCVKDPEQPHAQKTRQRLLCARTAGGREVTPQSRAASSFLLFAPRGDIRWLRIFHSTFPPLWVGVVLECCK